MKYLAGAGCLVWLLIIIAALTLGPICFDYSLLKITTWAGDPKDLPWYVDAVAGTILSEIVVPLAVVIWICSFFF